MYHIVDFLQETNAIPPKGEFHLVEVYKIWFSKSGA